MDFSTKNQSKKNKRLKKKESVIKQLDPDTTVYASRKIVKKKEAAIIVNGLNRDKPVSREQIENCYKMLDSLIVKSPHQFMAEFDQHLLNYMPQNVSTKAFEENVAKNRYRNILCEDTTRIVLSGGEHDYIHANLVAGPPLVNRFICTQGPLNNTIEDFFRMVVQEKVGTILMLCETMEMGKEKCAQYWPRLEGDSLNFGKFTIKNLGTKKSDERSLTTLLSISGPNGTHKVRHTLWLNWPDQGVPCTTRCALRLLRTCRLEKKATIIHCSAGIGRTGSLIGIEYCIQTLLTNQQTDLIEAIKTLRKYRLHAVQTSVQYLYVARVLITYLEAVLNGKDQKMDDVRRNSVAEFEKNAAAISEPAVPIAESSKK